MIHKDRMEMKKNNNGGSCPEQYALPEGITDLQDLIEHREMNFQLGNIFKACYRLGHCGHSEPARDLRKIIYFAERELQRIKPETVVEKQCNQCKYYIDNWCRYYINDWYENPSGCDCYEAWEAEHD